ncbi:ATP-binding cassette domain-containing protein [Kitasatospora sp. NPDC048365]|uniref:ATP-binding cassette domain-containing protein n=1 Tax=Kitasatospora sp. NPDC048365 TaxID=3364050 RepID=UPI00371FF17C
MIVFDQVSVQYADADAPALRDVHFTVPEGELCLLVGPSGCGKSTLLGTVNGLVPHFTGGTLHGRVTVDGRDTRTHRPRELADLVGTVGQDPAAHFVTDTVEDELAYGMESLGLAPAVMRRRVEETLDLLGLAELRGRALSTLSGGQRQRVAIGSVLTVHPKVLVLDEPTSALDPGAAEEVLAVLQRLVHDLGTTVLMSEHRLERVVQYADQVLLLPGDGAAPRLGDPAELMARSPVRPPVVDLGLLAGWDPLPLTVRDARRRAVTLRERLTATAPPSTPDPLGETLVTVARLAVTRGPVPALRGVDLELRAGGITALMGRNGAGKSTLLGSLVGLHAPTSGTVRVGGLVPHRTRPKDLIRRVGLVPQDPRDLLYGESVAGECAAADRDAGAAPGTCRELVARLLPGVGEDTHPRDLSEGQRLTLALAVVLTARPPVVLLDEPTRGLDYAAKARLVTVLRGLAADGHAILLATHDVELAAELADRTAVLADGEIVADGPTPETVLASPAFAPQTAKILPPYLTVPQVAVALAALHAQAPATPQTPAVPAQPGVGGVAAQSTGLPQAPAQPVNRLASGTPQTPAVPARPDAERAAAQDADGSNTPAAPATPRAFGGEGGR